MIGRYEYKHKKPVKVKSGITIHLDSRNEDEGFETTILFGKSAENTGGEDTEGVRRISASGRFDFHFGRKGYIELFAEKTERAEDLSTEHWGEI